MDGDDGAASIANTTTTTTAATATTHNRQQSDGRMMTEEGRPESAPCLTVANSSRKLGKRRNYCPYCGLLLSNYSRHLVARHSDEDDVREYIALKDASPRRRKHLRTAITDRIRHRGNRTYNEDVVEGRRRGPLLPARRPSDRGRAVDNVTHVVCKHCSGFFRKTLLFRHLSNCALRRSGEGAETDEDDGDASSPKQKRLRLVLTGHADQLVRNNDNASQILRDEVFPKMMKDEITAAAQSDSLICKFGSEFRSTHRKLKQVGYCSSRMRSLARIYLAMKKARPDRIKEFSDCIASEYFDLLVCIVRELCQYDAASGITNTPSVTPRVCSSLKRCANIIKSEAIKSESLNKVEVTDVVYRINNFLHLMEKDWGAQVGAMAEVSRRRRKVMRKDPMPDGEDVRTFGQYIESLCPRYADDLEAVPTVKHYERLAKLVIAHIIVLNRRRPNETVEITTEEYRSTLEKRANWGEDAQNVLTAEEMESSRDLVIFYVAANKNLKKVPVLLTREFHRALEVLLASQEKVGVKSRYMFGRPGSTRLFDGSVVLREIAAKAGLKMPNAFTANALRHHAATTSQLQSRDDTYTKRLSKFMGHDLQTHEHFYEMPLPLVQKSKVGHRLLQMIRPKDATTVRKQSTATHTVTSQTLPRTPEPPMPVRLDPLLWSATETVSTLTGDAGTSLLNEEESQSTSNVAGPDSEEEEVEVEKEENEASVATGKGGPPLRQQRSVLRDPTSQTTPSPSARSPHTPLAGPTSSPATDRPAVCDETPASIHGHRSVGGSRGATAESTSEESSASVLSRTPPKKLLRRRRWSSEEKRTVYEAFGQQFLLNTRPARSEIKTLWEKGAALSDRTLAQVVTYVNNIVTNKHHIPTPTRKKIKKMVASGRGTLSPLP